MTSPEPEYNMFESYFRSNNFISVLNISMSLCGGDNHSVNRQFIEK